MRKLLITLFILSGCTTEPYREFNVPSIDDPDCYAKYGGEIGYCEISKKGNK